MTICESFDVLHEVLYRFSCYFVTSMPNEECMWRGLKWESRHKIWNVLKGDCFGVRDNVQQKLEENSSIKRDSGVRGWKTQMQENMNDFQGLLDNWGWDHRTWDLHESVPTFQSFHLPSSVPQSPSCLYLNWQTWHPQPDLHDKICFHFLQERLKGNIMIFSGFKVSHFVCNSRIKQHICDMSA